MEKISTSCVIAGGGPAGMMLGVLLARAGVKVLVLEKHKDFLRDLRGDTIHPSTLQLMDELGWLDDFLKLPHQDVTQLHMQFGDTRLRMADFSHLPGKAKYIALMPQWDFLDFLVQEAKAFPNFHLRMQTEVKDLIAQKIGKLGENLSVRRFARFKVGDPVWTVAQIKPSAAE